MLKQMEQLNGRLSSIDGHLETIGRAVEQIIESGLLETATQHLSARVPDSPVSFPTEDGQAVDDDELMTVKQAYLEMNVSRSTIDLLRSQGLLTSLYQNKNVRLLRSEVEEAKKWYSRMKGKC